MLVNKKFLKNIASYAFDGFPISFSLHIKLDYVDRFGSHHCMFDLGPNWF